MVDELIDICDESNNLTGIQKMKSEAHRDGLWHRAAHMWIYNSHGKILLQLRAKEKLFCPNVWDKAAAGHVSAHEEPSTAALRELEEEIGLIVAKEDLQFFKIIKGNIIDKDIINNEFYYIYFLKFDGNIDNLVLQVEEVQKISFLSPHVIIEDMKKNPDKYVPHGEYWIEALMGIQNILHKS